MVEATKRHLSTVVVIDDGARDDTYLSAKEAGAVVLQHKKNFGKGMALRTGFNYVLENGFDAVITLDADNQHDPSEVYDHPNLDWETINHYYDLFYRKYYIRPKFVWRQIKKDAFSRNIFYDVRDFVSTRW